MFFYKYPSDEINKHCWVPFMQFFLIKQRGTFLLPSDGHSYENWMNHGCQNKSHHIEWKTQKICTKPTEPRIIMVEDREGGEGQKGCHSLVRLWENGNYHLVLAGIETHDAIWEVSMDVPQEPRTELSCGDSGLSQDGSGSAHHRGWRIHGDDHTAQETEPL